MGGIGPSWIGFMPLLKTPQDAPLSLRPCGGAVRSQQGIPMSKFMPNVGHELPALRLSHVFYGLSQPGARRQLLLYFYGFGVCLFSRSLFFG